MEQRDVERIARAALKDLGVLPMAVIVTTVPGMPGVYHVDFGGNTTLKVKCGEGSTAQWVRAQILEQYHGQT